MRIRYVLFVGILLLLSVGLACTREQPQQALTQFYQGNLAYREGNFVKAIEAYQTVLSQGFESGAVYYNLANSYLKNNQVALAIVYYERAQLLIPRDPDVKANAKYAASLLERSGSQQPKSFISERLDRYQEFWTLRETIWLMVGAYMVFGLIVFYWIVYARYKIVLVILSCLIVVFSVLNGWVLKEKIAHRSKAAIVLSESKATFEPLHDATVHFTLTPGDKVFVVEQDRQWFKIRRSDGRMGWVLSESLAMISERPR